MITLICWGRQTGPIRDRTGHTPKGCWACDIATDGTRRGSSARRHWAVLPVAAGLTWVADWFITIAPDWFVTSVRTGDWL